MGKIYKLNAGGTVGVSLSKEMKGSGYDVGKNVEWIKNAAGGWVLRLSNADSKPVVQQTESTIQPELISLK